MRRVVLGLLAIVLVNLPWANDAWVQHRLDASGVATEASVVKHSAAHGEYFIAYRLPKMLDPRQRLYDVQVTATAYRDAVATGRIPATVLPGEPGANRVRGEVTGSIVIVIAALGDVIILLFLGTGLWRRRRWVRLAIVSVADDEVTVLLGEREVTARLADDARDLPLAPGARVRAVLYLIPDDDVVPGPPLGELVRVGATEYRVAGRVRGVSATHTLIELENGYPLLALSDEVAHVAELRGPAQAAGTLVLRVHPPQ